VRAGDQDNGLDVACPGWRLLGCQLLYGSVAIRFWSRRHLNGGRADVFVDLPYDGHTLHRAAGPRLRHRAHTTGVRRPLWPPHRPVLAQGADRWGPIPVLAVIRAIFIIFAVCPSTPTRLAPVRVVPLSLLLAVDVPEPKSDVRPSRPAGSASIHPVRERVRFGWPTAEGPAGAPG